MTVTRAAMVLFGILAVASGHAAGQDVWDQVEHRYAENDGVRIHYASMGSGPVVVMIHGFPDFWYSWRHQMAELARDHHVVALDLRGYNLSDKPVDQESYAIPHLVEDVAAVIRDTGAARAVVVGHDWGGVIAWSFAMTHPGMTERLAVLNMPHPRGLGRELATNPAQQEASQYARDFQQPGAHEAMTPEGLAFWVTDPAARERYIEAFRRSDLAAMLAYYRENYPEPPYDEVSALPTSAVQGPVLLIHGLDDQYLLKDALAGTWDWIDGDLTLLTIPGVGHFVQHEAADLVTRTLRAWLDR